jgi:acyl-CoA dehydrogenase
MVDDVAATLKLVTANGGAARGGELAPEAGLAVALGVAWFAHMLPGWATLLLTIVFVLLAIPANLPVLRRKLVSDAVLGAFRKLLPPMSSTERDAIEAGTVWWYGELFSGRPGWRRLLATPIPTLTADERRFLDHDVEELCAMVTDWETTHVYRDLPPRVWQFIKDRGFLGMSIAKEYGGLGFSAYAHSQVMTKLSTHSGTVSVTVMVPNSLGPGELLAHYGADEQKRYYLPRLAKGLEIPCFALTAPTAGSDAASIPDYGIVCWGEHEGRRVLGLSVTWDKRYITLGPVATLLGLAFRAFDGFQPGPQISWNILAPGKNASSIKRMRDCLRINALLIGRHRRT